MRKHHSTICEINNFSENIITSYNVYREHCQILCNYLMSKLDNWQVYLTEKDINVFQMNFCYIKDRKYDTSFIITREQLENIKCTLDEVIIPTLVQVENSMTEEGCSC